MSISEPDETKRHLKTKTERMRKRSRWSWLLRTVFRILRWVNAFIRLIELLMRMFGG